MEHLPLNSQEEFAELSSDSKLQVEFAKKKLRTVCLNSKAEYPTLSDLAISVLLPFVSTYLCESTFSTLTSRQTKYRASIEDFETAM